jgi:hypothetical protein
MSISITQVGIFKALKGDLIAPVVAFVRSVWAQW